MPRASYPEQPSLEHFKIAFTERLTVALHKQGMNQTDLAKLLGLSRATISRWMTDYPNLSSKKLAELSSLLNVSLNWLLLGMHNPDRPVLYDLTCHERQILLVLNDLENGLREHFMHIVKQLESKRASTLAKPRLKADKIINDQRLPIAIIDMEGKIIYSNQYHDEFFGASAMEMSLANHSVFEIIPAFLHSTIRLEIQKTQFDGYSRNFKCTGKRLDTGAEVAFTVYARSIETVDRPAIFAIIFPDV